MHPSLKSPAPFSKVLDFLKAETLTFPNICLNLSAPYFKNLAPTLPSKTGVFCSSW